MARTNITTPTPTLLLLLFLTASLLTPRAHPEPSPPRPSLLEVLHHAGRFQQLHDHDLNNVPHPQGDADFESSTNDRGTDSLRDEQGSRKRTAALENVLSRIHTSLKTVEEGRKLLTKLKQNEGGEGSGEVQVTKVDPNRLRTLGPNNHFLRIGRAASLRGHTPHFPSLYDLPQFSDPHFKYWLEEDGDQGGLSLSDMDRLGRNNDERSDSSEDLPTFSKRRDRFMRYGRRYSPRSRVLRYGRSAHASKSPHSLKLAKEVQPFLAILYICRASSDNFIRFGRCSPNTLKQELPHGLGKQSPNDLDKASQQDLGKLSPDDRNKQSERDLDRRSVHDLDHRSANDLGRHSLHNLDRRSVHDFDNRPSYDLDHGSSDDLDKRSSPGRGQESRARYLRQLAGSGRGAFIRIGRLPSSVFLKRVLGAVGEGTVDSGGQNGRLAGRRSPGFRLSNSATIRFGKRLGC